MKTLPMLALVVILAGCSRDDPAPPPPSRTVDLSEPIPAGYRCSGFKRHPRQESGNVPQFSKLNDGIHFFTSPSELKAVLAQPLAGTIEESESWAEEQFGSHSNRMIAVALVSYSDQESLGLDSVGNLGELAASVTFYGVGETTNFDYQYPLAVFTLDPN